MLKELLKKSRSYRRFKESEAISLEELKELVNLTRFCPSAGNMQPLKYFLANTQELTELIFSCLAWAGGLQEWSGPDLGERPSAYIVMLCDTRIRKKIIGDDGITAQTIMLGAAEKGYGGCMLHAVNRVKLRNLLHIPEFFDISLVLALGVPNEQVLLEEVGGDGDTKYWRDSNDAHHVPKRKLEDIVITSFDKGL